MPDFEELIEKAKELAAKHPDQVHDGLEKAEDFVEKKVGGEHSDQIAQASDVVEGFLGIHKPES